MHDVFRVCQIADCAIEIDSMIIKLIIHIILYVYFMCTENLQ